MQLRIQFQARKQIILNLNQKTRRHRTPELVENCREPEEITFK